jgi:hypothetical protein
MPARPLAGPILRREGQPARATATTTPLARPVAANRERAPRSSAYAVGRGALLPTEVTEASKLRKIGLRHSKTREISKHLLA